MYALGTPPPPPHPMVPHPYPVRKAVVCAVVSRIRHELITMLNYEACMAIGMVAAILLMVLMMQVTMAMMMLSILSKMI